MKQSRRPDPMWKPIPNLHPTHPQALAGRVDRLEAQVRALLEAAKPAEQTEATKC